MSNTRVTVTFSRLVTEDDDNSFYMSMLNSGNYKGLLAEEIAKYEAQDADFIRPFTVWRLDSIHGTQVYDGSRTRQLSDGVRMALKLAEVST